MIKFLSSERDGVQVEEQAVLTFIFKGESSRIILGSNKPSENDDVFEAWSHTVFELEHFAEALKEAATVGESAERVVKSRDLLVGPTVCIKMATWSPINGTEIFCYSRRHSMRKVFLVDIYAMHQDRAAHGTFKPEDVLELSESIYKEAKALSLLVGPFWEDKTRELPSSVIIDRKALFKSRDEKIR